MGKIFVIGGGVSGLSAAIHSALFGHEVTLCEANREVGGALSGWNRQGYHVDNCIHWLTGTNPKTSAYGIWRELGALGEVPVYYGDSLFTYESGGQRLSLFSDLERTKEQLLGVSPEDEREIKSFFSAVEAVMDYSGLSDRKTERKSHPVSALARKSPTLLRYFGMTAKDLSKKLRHPAVSGFFTALLDEDYSALALIIVFANYFGKNAGIPEGSSVAMAKRMEDKFISLGGKLIKGVRATKINTNGNGVRSVILSDGSEHEADCIICATPPEIAFGKLLSRPLPKEYKRAYNNRRAPRFSAIQAAYSCDLESLPFSSDIIFDLDGNAARELGAHHLILREFSHERSFSKEGRSIIQVMLLCGERTAEYYVKLKERSPEAYKRKKEELDKKIRSLIYDTLPTLSGKLEYLDLWTPATYKRFLGSECGSFMSFILPASTLPKRRSCKVHGEDGLFLATQWAESVGGLPIAAAEGKRAAEAATRLLSKRAKRSAGFFPLRKIKRPRRKQIYN